jgi:hypothetical protein
MLSELDLLRIARERIDEGQLPRVVPERVWGSPSGAGEICALCDKAIRRDQPVLELDERFQFHVGCHAIWQRACREREAGAPSQRHSAERRA